MKSLLAITKLIFCFGFFLIVVACSQRPTATPTDIVGTTSPIIEIPTLTPTIFVPPTVQNTATPKHSFWIRNKPSLLPIVECPDEKSSDGVLESSYSFCRTAKNFWSPEGKYWGPIVKDDNAMNLDFSPIGLESCKQFGCPPDNAEQFKVFAVDEGVVITVDEFSVGWRILLEHEGEIISNYGHLVDPRNFVNVGNRVVAGQQIGEISSKQDFFLAYELLQRIDDPSYPFKELNPFQYMNLSDYGFPNQ